MLELKLGWCKGVGVSWLGLVFEVIYSMGWVRVRVGKELVMGLWLGVAL